METGLIGAKEEVHILGHQLESQNSYKKQKGICPQCKQHFTPEDLIEVDHIIPKSKGGKDTYNNLQALHRHCHDVKSKNDYLYDWLDKDYEWKDDVLIVPMTRD